MTQCVFHHSRFAAQTPQVFVQRFQCFLLCLTLISRILLRRTRAILGQGLLREDTVPPKSAIAAARNTADRNGRRKVIREPLALLFCCRVQQPHQHEKGHHRSHEVRVGDFPGTAMVPAALDNLLTFDDDWRYICLRTHFHNLFSPKAVLAEQGLRSA